VPFQGRNIAQEVDVTAAGKPYLKLRVETIELISHVDEVDFMPPPDAIGPFGEKISGVHPSLVIVSLPAWPTSLRGQHFSVGMEIVIGKDGHVVSAPQCQALRRASRHASKLCDNGCISLISCSTNQLKWKLKSSAVTRVDPPLVKPASSCHRVNGCSS